MEPHRTGHSRRTEPERRARPDRLDRRTTPETRDTSAGWRDEYAHAHVALPDGGVRELPETLTPGDRVRDRDDHDDQLVVVAVHNIRADEFILTDVDGEPTVAEVNEQYPTRAPVVHAVYVDDLDAVDGQKTADNIREAVDRGIIRSYAFPAPRLDPRGEEA